MSDSTSSSFIIASAQSSSGLIINDDQILTVQAGGTAIDTQLDPSLRHTADDEDTGGEEDVYGSSLRTQVNDGDQEVYSGGVSISATVGNEGTVWVDGSGTTSALVISSGGSAEIGNDESASAPTATAYDTTVLSGGNFFTNYNAIVNNTTVSGGGYMELAHKGAVASSVVVQSGGVLLVDSGNTVQNATVESGAFFFAEPGASASNVTGSSAGYLVTTDNNVIEQMGFMSGSAPIQTVDLSDLPNPDDDILELLITPDTVINSLTLTSATEIQNYGTLSSIKYTASGEDQTEVDILSGGRLASGVLTAATTDTNHSASDVLMNIHVASGGSASSLVIGSGTALTLDAEASGTQLSAGMGGKIENSVFSSGTQIGVDGGITSSNAFSNGTTETIWGGTTTNDTFLSGANLYVEQPSVFTSSGAVPTVVRYDTFTDAGMELNRSVSGEIDHNTFIGSHALANIDDDPNAVISANTYLSGASLYLGGSGTTTTGDIFENGALEDLTSGASVSSQTFSNASLEMQNASASDLTLVNASLDVGGGSIIKNTEITSGTTLGIEDADFENVTIDEGAILTLPMDETQVSIKDDVLYSTNYVTNAVSLLKINGHGSSFKLETYGDSDNQQYILEEGTPCYCRGTLIETDAGEVGVEALKIGDLVKTRFNGYQPIRWIGRRAYSGQFATGNRDVLPVVFKAGALGCDAHGHALPRQDLAVSPLHAMYLDEVLVPAVHLVNGTSIVQAEAMDEVAYFHIELEKHDIILANGVESETFVDDGSRGMFHNAADYARLYPDALPTPATYCAPRVEEGQTLETIRRRLNAQEAQTPPATGPLEGYLDVATRTHLRGWARMPNSRTPVRLRILDNGRVLGEAVADQARPDVGDNCGFSFDIPGGLSPFVRHVLEVRRTDDNAAIGHSPWIMDMAAHSPVHTVIPVQPSGPLNGFVDCVSHENIAGWAYNPEKTDEPVALQILDNGQLLTTLVANGLRPDVKRAGACPTERCGFNVLLPASLSPFTQHVIEIRREQDGALLGKPHVLPAATAFDHTVEKAVEEAVAAAAGQPQQDDVLHFLLAQAERLKSARAAHQSGMAAHRISAARQRRAATPAPTRRKRMLVIDTRLPDAGRDAGSCAVLSHMRACAALGYEISFVAADQMLEGTSTLKALPHVQVMTAPFYSSVEDVLRRQADSFDVIYLHRVETAARYTGLVRQFQKRGRILYSVADLHFVRLARQAQVQCRPELLAQARRMKDTEYSAMRQVDAVISHSPEEAALLADMLPHMPVHVVPWAVTARPRVPAYARRQGVVFVGNYGHAPNIDAARWLVTEIMPHVWATAPHIRCVLAGAEMPDTIRALAGRNVDVVGHVPDLTRVFDGARLSVAPLRFGAGIKGKVLDSLASGLPCVMTPVAAEGLLLPQTLQNLIGQDAKTLAALIVAAHEQEAFYKTASKAGRQFVQDQFSEQAVQDALCAAVNPAAARLQKVM
ncbi:Hint domain-containing protein [Acetobacter senegalensis]|uniref:Hint domain-containing protein n=1 Tax=Acetobacter senegalensis TaxID=446692 RepID=UPI001EDADA05|nr:Hint domain-containing protein [Acetobacter senegalensis]MCG4254333.1 Hint domain-containing protein [Acetobacter senegalensis]